MNKTASQYFGAMVREYDSLLARAVPRYAELIERTVTYIPPGKRRILELGCGTGNYTVTLAREFPDAHLTLVDGSREMLECARSRVDPGREVELVQGLFEEVSLEPGVFDLVTSTIALHHVTDMKALFARVLPLITPGEHFVFADQMRGGTEAYHAINWGRMTDFWHRPGHLDAAEIQSLTEHADEHDHYVSVVDQLRWLDEVGFVELDCVWRNWMWGVLSARRPG